MEAGPESSRENPNSGLVWEYRGPADERAAGMHGSLSSVAIQNGLLIATDMAGWIHCLNARTGALHWTHQTESEIFSSPLIVGDTVYVVAESDVFVFQLKSDKKLIAQYPTSDRGESSPVFANGVLYLTTSNALFAVGAR